MGVLGVLGVYVLYNYLQLMGGATVISNEDYPKVIMTIDLEMGLDWVGGWVHPKCTMKRYPRSLTYHILLVCLAGYNLNFVYDEEISKHFNHLHYFFLAKSAINHK